VSSISGRSVRYGTVLQSSGMAEREWDQRIFELVEPGVDPTLIIRNLRLTPTQRLERLQRVLESLAAAKRSMVDRSQPLPRNP
jgi:hypothetical protein